MHSTFCFLAVIFTSYCASICCLLFCAVKMSHQGLPQGLSSKESTCNAGEVGLIPGSGRFPWRRKWLPTPVLLPGKSHGQRTLVGYSHGPAKSPTRLSNWACIFWKVKKVYLDRKMMAKSMCFPAWGNELKWQKFPVFQQTSKALLSQASWQLFKTPCCHTYSKPMVNSP